MNKPTGHKLNPASSIITKSNLILITTIASLVSSVLMVVCMVALLILNPEYDPSWRLMSAYSHSPSAWILSLMYVFGSIGNLALALTIRLDMPKFNGNTGIVLLCFASALSAIASVQSMIYDVQAVAGPLWLLMQHFAAAFINATLSISLGWTILKQAQRIIITLMWVASVLFVSSMIILISGTISNGEDFIEAFRGSLHHGVINLAGYPNRLMLVVYSIWAAIISCQLIVVQRKSQMMSGY